MHRQAQPGVADGGARRAWTGARLAFALTLLAYSWLHFEWTHETGHVVGALATGGRVQRVVLHPLVFSRTDVSPNPAPLVEVWAGPVLGCCLGALASVWVRGLSRVGAVGWRAVAGFALLANGSYIGLGAAWPAGDAEVMRQLGTPVWAMASFGIAACVIGAWLWCGARERLPGAPVRWWHVLTPIAGAGVLAALGAVFFSGP